MSTCGRCFVATWLSIAQPQKPQCCASSKVLSEPLPRRRRNEQDPLGVLGRGGQPDPEPGNRRRAESPRTHRSLLRARRDGRTSCSCGTFGECTVAGTDRPRPLLLPLPTIFGYTSSPSVGEELIDVVSIQAPDLVVIDAMFTSALNVAPRFERPR